ncbi:hypothetical protein HKCCE3408_18625 [Rhodobacterales bacterium HKCCE3408]|nr:hypothetical protein [Rhodobacterales bacterium HKCCE3408]
MHFGAVFLATFALSTALAHPARALTCPWPNVALSFSQADARPEFFVVAVGRLERLGEPVPGAVGRMEYPAMFLGSIVMRDGLGPLHYAQAVVSSSCGAPSCVEMAFSDEALFFLRRHGDQLVLEVGGCTSFVFANPGEAELRIVRDRLR